jgi:outer membrane protein assembly factor BamB
MAFKSIVYIGGYTSLWWVYALSESNGEVLWTAGIAGYGGFPAVSDTAVYAVRACGGVDAYDRLSGARLWETSQTCSSGGGGSTPSLYKGRLYVRNTSGNKYSIVDAATGKTIRLFGATTLPAFDGSLGFFLSGSTLVAEDLATGRIRWAFTGDGKLVSSPIVVNGYVYIGSQSGLFYAVSALTGQQVWSDNSGVPFEDPFWIGVYGLGAGGEMIIATGGTRMVAYHGPRPPWWSTPANPGLAPTSPPLDWWRPVPKVSLAPAQPRSPSTSAVTGPLNATARSIRQRWQGFLSGFGSFAGFVPPDVWTLPNDSR